MARQESAAAGGGSGESDVVIVGESKRPVAIMRQKQSPWLAVDDDDDDDDHEEGEKGDRAGKLGGHGEKQGSGHGVGGDGGVRRRRRRRGSRDESEDPATALSVVSEQLWGLQQKLVGTYMAVARARLRRAFPDPVLVTTSSPSENEGQSSKGTGSRSSNAPRRKSAGKASAAGGVGEDGSRSGQSEDGPDEETRAELVQGALDSLCAAWEHLVEAKGTLDRRSATVFAGENAEGGGGDGGSDDRSTDDSELASTEGALAANRQDERAEKLGPLWKGSLSEALARSRQDSSGGSGAEGMHEAATRNSAGASSRVVDANGAATPGTARSLNADDDVLGRLAWTRAAHRQLESRRAELFELCGDVAHACVSLRARAIGAGIAMPAAGDGGSVASSTGGNTAAQRSLPARLQELLSSTRPPLVLEDLDVCQRVHGRVWEALIEPAEQGGARTSTSGSGKRGRGVNRSRTQAGSGESGYLPESGGIDEGIKGVDLSDSGTGGGGGSATQKEDPRPLAETCVHSLAKAGRVPGDPMAWSLCLAAEACYERALLDLDRVNPDVPTIDASAAADAGRSRFKNGDAMFSGVPEAQARIRKKLGDASNELGKLMAQCAGALVQAPAHSDNEGTRPASSSKADGASSASAAPTPQHPGLGCAVCVACAERWFRRSLTQFRAIDDARNTALLLCNLASVERLKPRALARLRDACPSTTLLAGSGGGGKGGDRTGGGKEGGPTISRGRLPRCRGGFLFLFWALLCAWHVCQLQQDLSTQFPVNSRIIHFQRV